MPTSAQKQMNMISLGFAYGLADLGRSELSASKVSFDLAFAKAWRKWPYAHIFPTITGRSAVDPYYVVNDYTERRHSPFGVLFWDGHAIYSRREIDDSDPSWDEFADDIHDDIPGAAWLDLVWTVMSDLDRD